ncbi:MAG: hypothetical protein M3457_02885 [Chloroflexota bacterium]|nr:hypothetical protein [Chloroflexota bacterium]
MAYDPTNAVTARALLEDAIALATTPTLTTAQVDRAFALASSLAADGVTIQYTASDLNRAAAWAWNLKAGLTSNQYDLGGGSGVTLDRSQWHAHCRSMAYAYGSGSMSVTGASTARGGIGSIALTTEVSTPYWDELT